MLKSVKPELIKKRKIVSYVLIFILILSGITAIISISISAEGKITLPVSININSNDDFVTQGWPGSGTESDPWIIENLLMDNHTIAITGTTGHFIIQDCSLLNFSGSGIYIIQASNGSVNNNSITNGTGGIYCSQAHNLTISDNYIANNSGTGIDLRTVKDTIIENNTLLNNYYDGHGDINFRVYSENITIKSNDIRGSHFGISIEQTNNSMLINNEVSNCVRGVQVSFTLDDLCYNTTVINNSISHSELFGMVAGGVDTVITHNNLYNNGYHGIALLEHGGSIVSYNTIFNNDISGILIETSYNVITNNTILNNGESGIYINQWGEDPYPGMYNTIAYNIIELNQDHGLYILSENNDIHHNWLTNNSEQAASRGNNEWWNNYWSDWKSPDYNGDGIVDESYIIDTDLGLTADTLPLVDGDYTRPIISDVNVVNDTECTYFNISANVTDYFGISSVRLIHNGTRYSMMLNEIGHYYVNLTGLGPGNHSYTINVIDNNGNENSHQGTVLVPPEISSPFPYVILIFIVIIIIIIILLILIIKRKNRTRIDGWLDENTLPPPPPE